MEKQQDALLPVPYFMVTFTIPHELHQVARRQQKIVYNILFPTLAEALQQLAQDPRYVGGQIGMIGVLHTWSRDLNYHPHVPYLVPAGGLTDDNQTWLSISHTFLVPLYKRLVQHSKLKNVARITVARKLLHIAWACVVKERDFDTNYNQQPKVA